MTQSFTDRKGKKVKLIDGSERNVQIASAKYPSATPICMDAQKAIGLNDYFDCILMVEFLGHLANPKKALQNALTALKRGGLMVLRGLPNNNSLEAFIGKDRWRMRQFIHHYHFFNQDTFATFVSNFGDAYILEVGTFLQERYRFCDVLRMAMNIGVVESSKQNEHITYDDAVVETADLTDIALAKIMNINFGSYKHRDRFPKKQLTKQSSREEVDEFFKTASLDQFLSPDFSVVIRKVRG